jgi:BirA family biotin operon repressor/biotin-[acetyl-CoA-carboxylase] ligase
MKVKYDKTKVIGQKIHYFKEVTSTNDVAKELAALRAKEGTIVIAEIQTSGRGRLGRSWLSPKGGVWLSVILRPEVKAKDVFKITFLTAVAVAKTIRKMFKLNAEIEWPNDVLINGKKVCGILTETSIRGETVDSVIVGVGINANVDLNLFPNNLKKTVTTLASEVKMEVDREKFLHALLKELEAYYKMFKENNFDSILEEWKQLNRLFGANVEVVTFNEKIEGQAVNVDQNGALIIRLADGTTRKVFSGDVTCLPKKDKARIGCM